MAAMEYHKGSFCVLSPILCQEGLCAECEIYRKTRLETKRISQSVRSESQKTAGRVLVH
jgi:tRNA1(Val) A37 N6-methylase TrmN6